LFVLLWCYAFYVYVLIFFYTVVELVIFVVGPTCMLKLKCVYLSHGAYLFNTSLVFLIWLQFISRLHIVKNAKWMWSQIVLWRSTSIHASI